MSMFLRQALCAAPLLPCLIGMTPLYSVISAAADAAPAQDPTVETVTVTATRVETPAFDVPASIDAIDGSNFNQDTLGVNLSEGLGAVPGLIARDRQNYAQDTQISIRGFGSRATFGIRGVRLYLDGIPATQPDGQGQISHFNLATADRVEVLRGPFSALYGNSSGGVIQLFTAEGGATPRISGGVSSGSFSTWRANLGASGRAGPVGYVFDYLRFETGGFRDHSSAERESFNGRVDVPIDADSHLTLLLNRFNSPDVDDPLGLSRAQFDDDPSQATPQAEQYRTRKSADQTQGGLVYDWRLNDANSLRLLGYYGSRGVKQYLSIPMSSQANPLSAGGVVDLDSDYGGGDARWTYRRTLAGRPLSVVGGLAYDALSQDRLGYENFVGSELGVQGARRRDEINDIDSFDQYLQLGWELSERWSTQLGARHSRVSFDSKDHYITTDNPDDSGRRHFSATSPVAGLLFRLRPQVHLYAAYGRGFETPTFAELAYRPDGASGLNFALDASRTRNAEIGAKFRVLPTVRAQLSLFQAGSDKEIVVATNAGGRSSYQNAGRTRRQGAEAQAQILLPARMELQLAATWIEAEVREDYSTCTGPPPCTAPNTVVPSGNRLPGVPEYSLFASLGWAQGATGWHAAAETRYLDAVPVNDVNNASAPSYAIAAVEGGYVFVLRAGRLRSFVRVDNLFDSDYVGSVIVNDGNGRYYEPGPERSVLAGLRMDWNL